MTFKDGEEYFGITFSAYSFSGVACMLDIQYIYNNGVVDIDEKDIIHVINNGLNKFGSMASINSFDADKNMLLSIREISKLLLVMMAALINKDHNMNPSNE